MGVRSGVNGLIPREDSWVIGTLRRLPRRPKAARMDAAPQSGTATADSTPWLVYKSGDVINAADLTGGTVVVSYEYSSDSVMTIRHHAHQGRRFHQDAGKLVRSPQRLL